MIFFGMFMIPVAVLGWLAVVSHSNWLGRFGLAAAAMVTFVGALSAPRLDPTDLAEYRIANSRDAIALLSAAVGGIYLLLWSRLHRGSGRNRTLAVIAALFGLVPILAAVLVATVLQE